MQLSNTGDILNSVLKAGNKLLGGSANLSKSPYAKIASGVLNQVANKAPGVLNQIQDKLGSSSSSKSALSGVNLASMGISSQTSAASGELPVNKALDLVREWDQDQDGTLSETEIQQGIAELQKKIESQTGRAAGGDAYEKNKLAEYQGMMELGQKMAARYSTLAEFDHQSGISTSDVKLLAFQDKNPYSISKQEFA